MSGLDGAPPAAGTRFRAANQQQSPAAAAGGAAPAVDGAQERKAAEDDPQSPQPHRSADSDAAADDAGSRDTLANTQDQLRAALQEIERLKQGRPQSPSSDLFASPPPRPHQRDHAQSVVATRVAALARTPGTAQLQPTAALAQPAGISLAQVLVLQSMGELSTFSGKGTDTTLIAHEWLEQAEDFFAAREEALGIDAAQGDKARLLNAARALTDDARRWY
ncbi:MAG: hypothetical protein ABL886_11080, partial [Rhodoglobus sp.]